MVSGTPKIFDICSGICGLHALFSICCRNVKHLAARTIEYITFIRKSGNQELLISNHGQAHPDLNEWTVEFMLKHFRECVHLPFVYNATSPTASAVAPGLSYFLPQLLLWGCLYRRQYDTQMDASFGSNGVLQLLWISTFLGFSVGAHDRFVGKNITRCYLATSTQKHSTVQEIFRQVSRGGCRSRQESGSIRRK